MESFAQRIRELRSGAGLTQRQLSKELDIPQSTIARYETGNLEANFDTLRKLADYFNCSIDYLLGRENY